MLPIWQYICPYIGLYTKLNIYICVLHRSKYELNYVFGLYGGLGIDIMLKYKVYKSNGGLLDSSQKVTVLNTTVVLVSYLHI